MLQGERKKSSRRTLPTLKKRYINGAIEESRDAQFKTYVEEWYSAYKKDKLSPSSRENYHSAMYKHIFPAFKDRQMRAIRAVELQTFMNSKAGMGKTVIGDIFSILTNAFAKATAQGIIDRDPARGLIKPAATKEKRRPLTEGETKATLKVAGEHPDGLLLMLLYYTGMRRGEVLGLQWRDVDFEAGAINVRRDMDFVTNDLGELKTPCSRRSIPMPSVLMNALNGVRGIGSTPVIPSPRSHGHWPQATFMRHWKALMIALYQADGSIGAEVLGKATDKAGKEILIMGSVLTPHYFRHNYASILYNAGVDVLAAQKILGHADARPRCPYTRT